MKLGLQQFDERFPVWQVLQLNASTAVSGTNPLVPTVSVSTRIDAVAAESTNTVATTLTLVLTRNSVNMDLAEVTVPVGAGLNAAMYQLLSAALPTADGSLVLLPGDSLQITLNTAIAGGDHVNIYAFGGSL